MPAANASPSPDSRPAPLTVRPIRVVVEPLIVIDDGSSRVVFPESGLARLLAPVLAPITETVSALRDQVSRLVQRDGRRRPKRGSVLPTDIDRAAAAAVARRLGLLKRPA